MNKNIVGCLLIAFFLAGVASFFSAAQTKEAHVTAVIKDVHVLAHNSQPRAAAVNDVVVEGAAVRTGGDSRAELTFADQTLTRIGANSVFSFGAGGKEFDLASGAMLLTAPKSAGTIHVNTAAATAAVSGFTVLFDAKKMIMLEGEACVRRKGHPDDPCITLHAGDLLEINNGRFNSVKKIDIQKVAHTARLVNGFKNKPLPPFSLNAINAAAAGQGGGGTGGQPPGGYYNDQTGSNAISQKNAASPPPPTPPPPPPSPPPSPPG
jgi:hypothetical protein